MSPAESSRTCCVCKKLFCCVECRERHEKKKHTARELSCPLCTSQKLPLQFIEDKSLLCHIVISHLPLHCRLCGEIFKQEKDLESFGTCKWWKSRHHHSLVSDQKSVFGTPPFASEGKESENGYNGNFGSMTSPPVLHRNTSTPVVFAQNGNLDFKTPSVPNFSFKTPKTDSASLNNHIRSASTNSDSNYLSLSSFSVCHKGKPFRLLSLNRGNMNSLEKNNSRMLGISEVQVQTTASEYIQDNNCVEDMELTSVENDLMLPDSQGVDVPTEKRSESMKRVRFSDQYEECTEQNAISTLNMTENEEYFEACDTMSEMKQTLESAQIKIYEEKEMNLEKENRSPEKLNQQTSSSSRVVMMVVVENNSNVSTSDLIDSGLKKLGQLVSTNTLSATNHNSPSCRSSISSVNSFYSASSRDYFSPNSQTNSPFSGDSSTSSNSSGSTSSGGIFSAVANAVKNVMKNFSGVGSFRNTETQQVSMTNEFVSRPSTSGTLSSTSSILRPGKRPRDAIESAPLPQRSLDFPVHQIEHRSPLAKRHRGWYKIKGREPIARMRNNHITSPRGVSSETQVFHQGSLSVGDTVLPLPSRAHQSTQTE